MILPPPRRWTAGDWWALAVLVGIAAALWAPRLQGPLDLRYDAGVYYVLGTSLAEGKGYRLLNEPGAIEAVQYPPVLPAVAALHERIFGTDDPAVVGHWLRISASILFLAYAAAIFLLVHRFLPTRYAFLGALLAILHAHTLFMSDYFATDVPYALVTSLFFLAGGGALAAGLAVVAFGLRTAGVALLGAWAAEGLLRRRYRQAALRGGVALLAVGGWQAYTASIKSSPAYTHPAYPYQRADYQFYNVGYLENLSYIDPFKPELGRASGRQWAARIWTNLVGMPISLGEAASLHRGWWKGEANRIEERIPGLVIPDWTIEVALIAISLAVMIGIALLAADGHWMVVLYILGSIALIALTPWPGQFARYLIPLTPFLTLALVTFAAALSGRAEATAGLWRWASRAGIAVILLIVGQQVYTIFKMFTKHHEPAVITDQAGKVHPYRLFIYDSTWQSHDASLTWLAKAARPGSVVATSTPHWTYLKTGLPSIMPPYEPDAARAEQQLEGVPVSYLVIDNLDFVDVGRRYGTPVVRAFPSRWKLVYAAEEWGPRIYQWSPPAGAK
jgi:hypothetical protein